MQQEHFGELMKVAFARGGTTTPEDDIPENDLYFIFDSGKQGNITEFLKPFAGKQKSVQTFLVHKDEELTQNRIWQGVGHCVLPA